MNLLVTGGAGFIGSHTVDALLERGDRVAVVDNLCTGSRANLNPAATFYEMDIQSPDIATVIQEEKITHIMHCAAQIDVRKSVEDPVYDARVNILGSINLLQLGQQHGVKKFVLSSTGGAIYGEQDCFPADEKHPLRPISPYGICKLTIENYLFYFQHEFGLDYFIVRYANVYGPRQNSKGEAGVVAIFCDRLLEGGEPVINGDGTQTRDYVYVGDVVRANLMALDSESPDIVNIGTGVETDVNQIFTLIRDALAIDAAEKHGPGMPGEQQRSVIDNSKAASLLGWRPQVMLTEGIKRTAAYFRQQHQG
ncbi:MAG: NAD-dependent epimerase/dehydratase family protein [Candidatus Delongbacteria bacterium]|nr:NAD-dependent epimerase/dehydratase family protein [Candidatus Delongbacteria bacterium]